MKKKLIALCLTFVFVISCLGGCSNETDQPSSGKTLTVLNYGKYFDADALKQFEKETGIDVKYEEYESPEEMYTKYKAGSIDYDIICTSEYIIQKLINEGEVLEQDYSSLSNYGNLDPMILELAKSYDPKNSYSVPYFYGTLGICYDTTAVTEQEASSWDCLWDDAHKNEIIMMNSVRDSFTPALKKLGYSLNTTDNEALEKAYDLLEKQIPLIYAYFVDEIADEMISGNAHMALTYSGEAALAMESNPDLAYSVPKEGSNLWVDSWFIPKTCNDQEAALKFIDYVCREDVGMSNFEYVCYASPLTPVVEALDEEVRNDEAIIPSKETLEKCEVYVGLTDDDMANLNRLWQLLKSKQ